MRIKYLNLRSMAHLLSLLLKEIILYFIYIPRSVGLRIDKGWGQAVQAGYILTPAQNFGENG